MQLSPTLHKIGFWITIGTLALIPVFFLPITSEYYEFNKQMFLLVSSLGLLIIWTVTFVIDRQVRVTRSPFGVPLVLFAFAWLASAFLRSPNRVEAFLQPNSVTTVVSLVIFFFAAVNLIRTRKDLDTALYAVIGSFSLLSVITIGWASGLMSSIIPFASLKFITWTPSGNPLASLIIHLSFIPFLLVLVAKEKTSSAKTFLFAVSLFLTVIAAGLMGYRLFSNGSPDRPIFLPQSVAWSISLETLKNSPLFGSGPSTFLTDFTQFRPVSFNLNPNWAIRFSTSSNYYLHILTTVGLLGLITYLFLVFRALMVFAKTFRSASDSPFRILSLASFGLLFVILASEIFTPASFTVSFLTIVSLIFIVLSLKHLGSSLVQEANIDIVAASDTGTRTPLLPAFILSLSLLLALPSLYLAGRAYYAEVLFQKAVVSAAKNDGNGTYNSLSSAINLDPYLDTYRVAFSQANLLIANSLAAKPNLSDSDRATVSQLVQQSINEAKNAVTLNPVKIGNLENLASVYQSLLNLAQGADAWTLASYQQAILLDPANPNLRIALGGLYYANKNYDQAIIYFQQAVDLKPNLANAYYNLAAAYREKGDYSRALVAMQSVTTLVDRGSSDFTKAQTELADLQQKVGQNAQATNPPAGPEKTQLQSPQPLPTPKLNPPLKLPADLGPATPSSTPQVTPAP